MIRSFFQKSLLFSVSMGMLMLGILLVPISGNAQNQEQQELENSVIYESTPVFQLRTGRLARGDLQVYYKLHKTNDLTAFVQREHSAEVLALASATQRFQMNTVSLVPIRSDLFLDPRFWDFENLDTVLGDVDFRPETSTRALMTYPVRQASFGQLPPTFSCIVTQKLLVAGRELDELWSESGFSGRPAGAVVQSCVDYSMMFHFSSQVMFFIPAGEKTYIVSMADFYLKKETIEKINWIPLVRAESRVGGALATEIMLMKNKMVKALKDK